MRDLIYILFVLLGYLSVNAVNATPDTLMSFDFEGGQIENGFDDWYYSDKGSNPCQVYGGEEQSKLCNESGFKFFPYYNARNSDHMGWMRYGFIDASEDIAVSGTALKVRSTGGVYKNEDLVATNDGTEIKSKSDYTDKSDLGTQDLEGDTTLYYKGPSSTSSITEFQGSKNRLTVWLLMPKDSVEFDDYNKKQLGYPQRRFAFYPYIDSSSGAHYYHHTANIPMGGWTKIQFDASPTHKNSGVDNELHALPEGGTEYEGNGSKYFNNTKAFALRPLFLKGLNADTYFIIDEIETFYSEYENEATIRNLSVGYNPDSYRFDISLEDKYRCTSCAATYEVRYSFAPINNINFEQAFLPKNTINFEREMNNADGLLHKTNNGYNLVWGALELQDKHNVELQDGSTVYFAVKDVSNRLTENQFASDFDKVLVPNLGYVSKMDLIKTIDYTLHPVSYPLEIVSEEIESPVVQYNFESALKVVGGTPPYSMQAQNLPNGISLNQNGYLEGVASKVEQLETLISVTDSKGLYSEKKIEITTITESELKIPHCRIVVDFDSAGHILDTSSFTDVFHDKYTDAYKDGMTIIIGENANYNYQGITGSGLYLREGDEIRAIWKNEASYGYSFTPRLSFLENGRISDGNSSAWYEFNHIYIEGNATLESSYIVPEDKFIDIININSNFSNTYNLLLDRVEIISSQYSEDELCEKPTHFTKSTTALLVDFEGSDEESTFAYDELSTIIKDKYTDYFEDGLAITVGMNKNYNYQGITGEGITIPEGKKLKIYWKNYNDYPIDFTPMISFSDIDRKSDDGDWLPLSNTSILTYDSELGTPGNAVSEIVISAPIAGLVTTINVNSQVSDFKGLVLDKIELVDEE